MKIVFTGGGTGGHFYPIIAVAEAVRDIVRERRLLAPRLYYIAPTPFDPDALFENEIQFIASPAGKMRRYASIWNITDFIVTAIGFIWSFIVLLRLYPDIVVSKGGYASVPTVLAAALLGIPILVHESDAKPGRANLIGARFAYRIAIAFESAAAFFPKEAQKKIARTGIPIRKELAHLEPEGARQYLGLDSGVPTVLILGGSSGAARINDVVLASLPELVQMANVIHQTGRDHYAVIERTAKVVLSGKPGAEHYHPFPFLNTLSMRRSAGAADLIISRAGATAIAEIALWGKPAILIPIPEEVSHDQRTNAYSYAHTGGAIVLEEANLTPHVLVGEVRRLLTDKKLAAEMAGKGQGFTDGDAATIIANEIVAIGLSHEQ